jgi:WD40 repeat protein
VSDDSHLALWDFRNVVSPTHYVQTSPDGLNAVSFSLHDENTLLTGGQESGDIWLWDIRKLEPMKPLSSFTGHNLSVTNITFSKLTPNIFCSGAQIPNKGDKDKPPNSGVIIWDIEKIGEETHYNEEEECMLSPCIVLSHDGHEATVDDISWSPYNERTLATVDSNRSMNIFQISEELFQTPLYYENEFKDK